MAAQGERGLGDIVMGEGLLDPMAQEEEIEQEMLVVEEEQFIPPQMDPEPEMGAEAAVYDTSPPLPHQNPSPIPAESAQPVTFDMAQLVAILAHMGNKMDGIKNNTNGIKEEMKEEMKKMRGEMQNMGQSLQRGTGA